MASLPLPILLLHFTFLLLTLFSSATTSAAKNPNAPTKDLLHTSCAHATYPTICEQTLSSYSTAKTPSDLAKAAVRVSLTKAHEASDYMNHLKTQTTKKQQNPLRDCVEQMADCVDELTKTLSELQQLRGGVRSSGFKWQMSNLETWVSAALTNEDSCLDGFKEVDGKVRSDVKEKISNVARVTSNALYLINRLYHERAIISSP